MAQRLSIFSVIPALLVVALIRPAGAQPDLAAKLAAVEKAVDAKREELHIPGASLVIVKDDKVIYVKGFGLRDVEAGLPVTPQTLFAIGSSSKAFTAMTVLMSADDGKLTLADPPKKHLPYFKLQDAEADSKITVGDLLCHRSGLQRTDLAWGTGRLRAEDLIRTACAAKPTAKFGAAFQYQNVMYLTAGEVVGKAQKTTWPQFLARRIFRPLGMSSTNTSVRATQTASDFALGYDWNAKENRPIHAPMRDLACIAPAGAINSNAVDMAMWVRFMLGKGVFQGKRLVSEKSFDELFAKRIGLGGSVGYGYGWFLREWNGHKVMEHGGNIDGFNAQVALMPDQNLGLALLTNVSASPLGAFTMDTVWDNLVGGAKNSADAAPTPGGPASDPSKEAGTYRVVEANVSIQVEFEAGRLVLKVPGQPSYTLESLGGRRYKLGSPAPAGFFATFRPSAKDPKRTEVYMEQPTNNVALIKEEATEFNAPIAIEELMRKHIEAIGGGANLRKHRSVVTRSTAQYENQGVVAEQVAYAQAPNLACSQHTLLAVGKRIGFIRDFFDGKAGGLDISFSTPQPKTGTALADAAIAADFYPELDWKTLFKTVRIKAMSKVGEEEAYVVEKTPAKGSSITDYISTKSFLLLKRDSPGGISVTFSEYRPVDGVEIPFYTTMTHPAWGKLTTAVKSVQWNAYISPERFPPIHNGIKHAPRLRGVELGGLVKKRPARDYGDNNAVTLTVRVRYFETDQMRVAHHAHYFVWFESARSEFCRARGIDYSAMERAGYFMPVVEARCRYKLPVRYDDEISIRVVVAERTRRTLRLSYSVTRDGAVVAEGETTQMLIDREGRPRSFTPDIAARFDSSGLENRRAKNL